MGGPLIEIENLSFRYSPESHWLWENLSISFGEGETVAIMGPSGCGKSSLLRLLLGSLQPEIGTVRIRRNLEIAMVFQDQRLLPWKTAEENVIFGLPINGRAKMGRVEKRRLAANALAQVHALHLAKRYPHQLSGGEKQRVSLARAIARRADLILMDEPLSAIDEISQRQLLDCLLQMKGELRTSILYVTHSHDEACVLGDRILLHHMGQLRESASQITLPVQQVAR